MSTGMAGRWRRLHDTARHDGTRLALLQLYQALGQQLLVAGPNGHAVAPVEVIGAARRVWPYGDPFPPVRPPDPPPPLRGSGLLATRVAVRRPSGAGSDTAAADIAYRDFLLALTWLRLGLSRRMVDEAMVRLRSRFAGGVSLLSDPGVRATLVDVMVEQVGVHTLLAGRTSVPAPVLVDAHGCLSAADLVTLRLFGAAGFTCDGPGATMYSSQLLADAYLPEGGGW